MNCPYCAEEIKDAAVLCRFCGARRVEGAWLLPLPNTQDRAPTASAAKSNFTIVSSGWLLMLSGVGSLISLTAPVALLGSLHEGAVAIVYNLTFVVLFGGMGYALAYRKPWALPITFVTSVAYTLDKLEAIFDETASKAALGAAAGALGDLGPVVQQVLVLTSVLFVVLWWAFVAYLYLKRGYFRPLSEPASAAYLPSVPTNAVTRPLKVTKSSFPRE